MQIPSIQSFSFLQNLSDSLLC